MESRYLNAVATVQTWRELAAEAKRLKAKEAHAELSAAVLAGDEALERYKPLAERFRELQAAAAAAQREADKASAAVREGRRSPADCAVVFYDARAAQMLVDSARGELVTLINRGIEKKDAVVLGPFREATAVTEAIVRTSLEGHNQAQFAAMAQLDDESLVPWEPIAFARALRDYPELSKDRAYASRCDSLEQLKEVFAYRRGRREGRSPAA